MVKIGLSDYEIYDRGVKSPNGGGNRVPPVTICRQTLPLPLSRPRHERPKFGNTVLRVEFLALFRSKGENGFRLTIGKTRVEKYSQLIEFQCALSCCELRVVNVGGEEGEKERGAKQIGSKRMDEAVCPHLNSSKPARFCSIFLQKIET